MTKVNPSLTCFVAAIVLTIIGSSVSDAYHQPHSVDYNSFNAEDLLYPEGLSSDRLDDMYNDESSQDESYDMSEFQAAVEQIAARNHAKQERSSATAFNNKYDYEDEDNLDFDAQDQDQETESHSSLQLNGVENNSDADGNPLHQYVSGGAGEGSQHLQPDGGMLNTGEIKSDEDLPAYCNPPNPCPVGYEGEDCDRVRKFADFNADYSKQFQDHQSCMCDSEHNACRKPAKEQQQQQQSYPQRVVAKKSPTTKRRLTKRITNM